MSQAIYKYTVPVDDRLHDIDMPIGAEIVHVAVQNRLDEVCFWAIVNNKQTITERRSFIVVGTGHAWPSNTQYVGTALAPPLVWHLLRGAW